MKNTILSENEATLIEDLIVKYGNIFTFDQVYDYLEVKLGRQDIRNRVSKLLKNGWLVSIKRGLYAVSSIEARGTTSISMYKIAQLINKKSYVSFEAALQYHSMYDQMLQTITSVSLNRIKTKKVQGIQYKYISTKDSLYYGFNLKRVGNNEYANIACAEKAILDMLAFNKSIYTIYLILEKLINNRDMLNIKRFHELLQKQNITTKRIVGYLFDQIGINSKEIEDMVKGYKGYSKISDDSKQFNSKWNLYYPSQK